jgi:hypothetical protein
MKIPELNFSLIKYIKTSFSFRSLKSYYPEQIILFALSYFERDMTSKADDILASFKESGALIDDKTLNWVIYIVLSS